jgi:large subunit ribosomal protein L16
MTSKQISALKQTINKIIKKKGKLKINIFPNTQITKKPLEVRMGKGKGNLDR